MEPASVSQTLRKVLAWMTPATPPPPPPRRRPRVRVGNRRRLPGARWRLPLAQLAAVLALLVLLGGCGSRVPSAVAGPLVLALSIFGLCLRPARAQRTAPPIADAPCRAVVAGNLTARHAPAPRTLPGAEPAGAGPRPPIPDLAAVLATFEVRP